MYIVKLLKRRDAASVVVAIVLAMILMQVLQNPTFDLANRIIGEEIYGANGPGWRTMYLQPLVASLLMVIALEVVLRLAVFVRGMLVRRAK